MLAEGSRTVQQTAQKIMRYRRLLLVFLPFAGGYFLSYFYRTINAVISAEPNLGHFST